MNTLSQKSSRLLTTSLIATGVTQAQAAASPCAQPAYHLQPYVEKVAAKYQLPPLLLSALIQAESNYCPNAVSSAGAIGLGQLMPGTARDLGVTNPYDPVQNINGAARYLKQQLKTFGSIPLALAAYNAGPGNVIKYGGIPPFRETQNYVQRITTYHSVYLANQPRTVPLGRPGGSVTAGVSLPRPTTATAPRQPQSAPLAAAPRPASTTPSRFTGKQPGNSTPATRYVGASSTTTRQTTFTSTLVPTQPTTAQTPAQPTPKTATLAAPSVQARQPATPGLQGSKTPTSTPTTSTSTTTSSPTTTTTSSPTTTASSVPEEQPRTTIIRGRSEQASAAQTAPTPVLTVIRSGNSNNANTTPPNTQKQTENAPNSNGQGQLPTQLQFSPDGTAMPVTTSSASTPSTNTNTSRTSVIRSTRRN